MNILALRHYEFDDVNVFSSWAHEQQHDLKVCEAWLGVDMAWLDWMDMLLILGGPMGVYEEDSYPWLKKEKHFVQEAIHLDKKILGICFGAQMLAEVLGGRVYPHTYKEIGWHQVQRTQEIHPWLSELPEKFVTMQWHGDTYDLPEGASLLATSAACRNQAFAYGERIVGLQFHLEMTKTGIENAVKHWSHELQDKSFIQSADSIEQQLPRCEESARMLRQILVLAEG